MCGQDLRQMALVMIIESRERQKVFLIGHPWPLFVYFRLFVFLQQINVKNVNPLYCAGIRTHNLQNMSLLP